MKIFVVEDSRDIREKLREHLEALSDVEIVGEADDIPNALKNIPTLRPELIILDLDLPSGSGLEILREVKKTQADIRVVVFSALDPGYFQSVSLREGADYFFDKTSDFFRLVSLIKRLAQQKQ